MSLEFQPLNFYFSFCGFLLIFIGIAIRKKISISFRITLILSGILCINPVVNTDFQKKQSVTRIVLADNSASMKVFGDDLKSEISSFARNNRIRQYPEKLDFTDNTSPLYDLISRFSSYDEIYFVSDGHDNASVSEKFGLSKLFLWKPDEKQLIRDIAVFIPEHNFSPGKNSLDIEISAENIEKETVEVVLFLDGKKIAAAEPELKNGHNSCRFDIDLVPGEHELFVTVSGDDDNHENNSFKMTFPVNSNIRKVLFLAAEMNSDSFFLQKKLQKAENLDVSVFCPQFKSAGFTGKIVERVEPVHDAYIVFLSSGFSQNIEELIISEYKKGRGVLLVFSSDTVQWSLRDQLPFRFTSLQVKNRHMTPDRADPVYFPAAYTGNDQQWAKKVSSVERYFSIDFPGAAVVTAASGIPLVFIREKIAVFCSSDLIRSFASSLNYTETDYLELLLDNLISALTGESGRNRFYLPKKAFTGKEFNFSLYRDRADSRIEVRAGTTGNMKTLKMSEDGNFLKGTYLPEAAGVHYFKMIYPGGPDSMEVMLQVLSIDEMQKTGFNQEFGKSFEKPAEFFSLKDKLEERAVSRPVRYSFSPSESKIYYLLIAISFCWYLIVDFLRRKQ